MSPNVLVHCGHAEPPRAPLPPGYASSFADFSPLERLYFCEECDAIRCDECIGVEVASYYCPSCLFDVPSANVRADKNRCARSCFACPQCQSGLSAVPTDYEPDGTAESSTTTQGAPYFLVCPTCKWSSKSIGWLFDKPSALAGQAKQFSNEEAVQSEYDSLKDHLDAYISRSGPQSAGRSGSKHSRTPSRHIAQLTQAASRALGRDVPGLPPLSKTARGARFRRGADGDRTATPRDEIDPYLGKATWADAGLEKGLSEIDSQREMGTEDVVPVERRWATTRDPERLLRLAVPQRVPLQAKLTKRCPHPTCRHILIQPDTKSVRMAIKTFASNYIPAVELGQRRRRVGETTETATLGEEDMEKRRRERRRTRVLGQEVDEDMSLPLEPGGVYTFQLAFTNALYDPIQIRLAAAHQQRPPVAPNHHLHIPVPHFTVGALKDAWAYDEDDELDGGDGDEVMGSVDTTTGHKSRLSMGGGRQHNRRDAGVEKRGNVTKVGIEVEIALNAEGPVEFDLEIRFTYRADDAGEEGKEAKAEYKTFTFWTRVAAGAAEQERCA